MSTGLFRAVLVTGIANGFQIVLVFAEFVFGCRAVAVGAVILHSFLPEWRLYRPVEDHDGTNALQQMLLQCNISITALY